MADDNETEFDYLATVKLLLGINDNDTDEVLRLYLSIVKQQILNYCNISELPSALDYTLCEMVADIYRDSLKKNGEHGIVGNVASVSEDGRSVSFTNGTEMMTAVNDKISKTTELNRFKKLYRI